MLTTNLLDQRLKAIGQKNKLANEAAHASWLKTVPLADVRASNLARLQLAHKHKVLVPEIHDPRLPKRPLNAFTYFSLSKWSSGVLNKEDGVIEIARGLGREWKVLPEAQKKVSFLPFLYLPCLPRGVSDVS